MVRGEIWWASLRKPRKSELGYNRPVLIIQADSFSRSKISTVVCAIITSNLALEKAPGNVRIGKKESNLPRESVINVSQIVTIDKAYLTECIGAIPIQILAKVEMGLKLVLALS
ncbi:MAG: type II toxin-antitoxin system PemK/MazF family toxin [Dehalococcoidia bacterium]|jgi:mRNA interferase MazF|nr:MAG: type II toxin-antitoxin system PemK/MazF family toxin [Dehalococcoidia bacterium]